MSNNQFKKLAAFYHNQEIDYERWLKVNTLNQQRQRRYEPRSNRLAIASALVHALHSGFSARYV